MIQGSSWPGSWMQPTFVRTRRGQLHSRQVGRVPDQLPDRPRVGTIDPQAKIALQP